MGCANASTRMKHHFPFIAPHWIVPQLRLFYETDVGQTDTFLTGRNILTIKVHWLIKIQEMYVLPTLYLCVLCSWQYKQLL
jgi:hypothetical protein